MKSFISTLAWAVLAGLALAKPQFTNGNYNIEAGKPFTLTWTGATSVTINLKNGPPTNLKTVQTIVSGATGGSYVWTPTGLPGDTYALEIIDPTDPANPNYSSQFVLAGPTASTSDRGFSASGSTASTDSTSTATTVSAVTVTSSASTTKSTSGSTSSSTTTSGTASKTSTSASTTTTAPPNTAGGSHIAPVLAPLLFVAGLAAF